MRRVISALFGESGRTGVIVFSPRRAAGSFSRRTHAAAFNNLPRTIHKLDSANKVISCAVFFFNPR